KLAKIRVFGSEIPGVPGVWRSKRNPPFWPNPENWTPRSATSLVNGTAVVMSPITGGRLSKLTSTALGETGTICAVAVRTSAPIARALTRSNRFMSLSFRNIVNSPFPSVAAHPAAGGPDARVSRLSCFALPKGPVARVVSERAYRVQDHPRDLRRLAGTWFARQRARRPSRGVTAPDPGLIQFPSLLGSSVWIADFEPGYRCAEPGPRDSPRLPRGNDPLVAGSPVTSRHGY